jgi:hypothetical protein
MSYTYSVDENIATSGRGMTSGERWRYTIKNDGRVVKTGYQFTQQMADRAAVQCIAKFERKGGSWIERLQARADRKAAAK